MQDDNLESQLDAALARYAAVEPREGLEQRVLANLRAHRSSIRGNVLNLGGAVFAAVAIVVVMFTLRERKTVSMPVQPRIEELNQARGSQVEVGELSSINRESRRRQSKSAQAAVRIPGARNVHRTASAFSEGASQFPSPQPLSEQEKLLVRYVEVNRQQVELTSEVAALIQRGDGSKSNPVSTLQDEW